MMKYFYTEYIEIETLITELDEMGLKGDHKHHLANLIDAHIHHTVLDLVMSRLNEEDKLLFIKRFKEDPEDEGLMEFLSSKAEGIETEINTSVKELIKELHKDVKDAKRLHPKGGR